MFFVSCLVFLILSESWNSLVMIGVSFKVKLCRNFVGIVFGCVVLCIFRFVSSLYNMYKLLFFIWMFFMFWCGLFFLDGLFERIFVV